MEKKKTQKKSQVDCKYLYSKQLKHLAIQANL